MNMPKTLQKTAFRRNYPIGAELAPGKGVHFRVWAPDHKKVELVLENVAKEPVFYNMHPEREGYFSYFAEEAKATTHYRFRLSNSKHWYPDPASRYQPNGPSGTSEVIDPSFNWKDENWEGLQSHGQVAYEMHIGTFTRLGTFASAMKELPRLADLGITFVEILPINDFPGHFGWGYDGVNLYAPTHLYGTPNDVKKFVDKAHSLGIGVVLDVVYNHMGPEDNTIIQFAKEYISKTYSTDWGQAINFDSKPSREFFLTNARYWIEEFHFDGLRVDATPWFFCSSPVHILAELTQVAKAAGKKKNILMIGENEPQDTKLLHSYETGGYGFDMLWNDDFHHTSRVRLTGKREAYYTDYLGSPQEFISLVKYGFLYQGQYYVWQEKPRGTPDLNIPHQSLVVFLENHDQVANTGQGLRLHKKSDPGNYKALTTLLLLGPNTPLIFQGQEFNSSQPFFYFADHGPHLSPLIRKGRKDELAQFPRLATSEIRKILPDPDNPITFFESKLHSDEIEKNENTYNLFHDLIKLRKTDPVFQKMHTIKIDGAVLGTDSFLLRYFGEEDGDRVLLFNFGPDHYFNPGPEPLLVPGKDQEFEVLWSSENTSYGGEGTPPINIPYWKILGHSAVVLKTKKK